MYEYRCTRNQPYRNPNCLGHTDTEARQSYYVMSENIAEAIDEMQQRFMDDAAGFTAEFVKEIRDY